MKKVLFVVDEKKLGGVSILLEGILNNLNKKNLDITVLVLNNTGDRLNNIKEKVIYGTKAFSIVDKDLKYLIKNFKLLSAVKKIVMSFRLKTGLLKSFTLKQRKILQVKDYDIEIAFKSGFCSTFVAYGNAANKINWIHEDYKTYNKTKRYEKTFKRIFNMFDKHITVSNDAKKSFCDIYGNKDKTFVIENYIDTENILTKANEDISFNIDKNKLNLVTLGRFCYEKGFDRLINAFSLLKKDIDMSNTHLYIIGYGSEEILLKQKINKLNLQENIEVINSNSINAYAFMKNCDAYIMSSRSESFGMVRVEALTLKLPVLTTNVANSKELIQDKYGIVLENSTQGLYNGLKQLITNKSLIDNLKINVKDYSYNKKNEEILDKINKLLEE